MLSTKPNRGLIIFKAFDFTDNEFIIKFPEYLAFDPNIIRSIPAFVEGFI